MPRHESSFHGRDVYKRQVLGSMVLVGTSLTPSSASRDLVGAVGGTLLVPIAGPFVSGVLSASYQWAAPWILIDGAAQIAGLAMLVSGARSVPDLSLIHI